MTDSYTPVLRTDTDVLDMWCLLMNPLGVSRPTLWMVLVDADDRPLPVVHECPDVPVPPTAEEADHFGVFLATLLAEVLPGGRVALLASRPGRGGLRPTDRGWAGRLYAAARQHGVPLEVVHVATDDQIVPVPLDDLDLDRRTGLPRSA